MAEILALEHLYDVVGARLAADAASADPPRTAPPMAFGWREPARASNVNARLVWVPGDWPSGDAGRVTSARQPGRIPRPLATWEERFTILVEAVDRPDVVTQESDRAQYRVVRRLFNWLFQALYTEARGQYALESLRWLTERETRRAGATLKALFTVQSMIPDSIDGLVEVAGAGADVTVSTFDVDDHLVIDPIPDP